jgi:hypothetical protein
MPKAARKNSTPGTASKIRRARPETTRKTKGKKFESAITKVPKSGLELVRARKRRGKPATLRDLQTIDFKPWARAPGATKFIPTFEDWNFYGTNCRIAYGMCLKTRDELIAMHGKMEHETTDAMMAGLLETGEALKEIVEMCEGAYARVLASAAAAYKAGVKFRFAADRKPGRRKAVPADNSVDVKIKAGT